MSNMTDRSNQNLIWAARVAVALILAVVGYFVREWAQEQRRFNDQINQRVAVLEVEAAKVSGNRFTSGDWVAAKTVLDERDVNLDKRITRVEDAIPAIKLSLERIENKLDAQK